MAAPRPKHPVDQLSQIRTRLRGINAALFGRQDHLEAEDARALATLIDDVIHDVQAAKETVRSGGEIDG